MKKQLILINLLVIGLFQANISTAQNYSVTESKTILKDYLHKIFAMEEKYVDIIYASPHGLFSYDRDDRHAKLNVYDRSMNQLYEKEITAMNGLKYEAGLVMNGRLYIFATDKKQKLFGYELNTTNGSAKELPEDLFELPSSYYNVLTSYSPDSAYCYISFTNYEKKGFLRALVMDKNMKVVHRLQGDLSSKMYDISFTSLLLSNSGSAIGIAALNNRPGKKDNTRLKYSVLEFDKDGNMSVNLLDGLPTGYLSQFSWTAIKSGFSFTAFLATNDKDGYTSLVSGEYNVDQRKIENLSQSTFNMPVPTNTWFISSYILKDLSHYFLLEARHVDYFYDRTTGRPRGGNYWAGNVYVVKTTPDNKAEWVRQIQKSQLEAADWIYTGTTSMLDKSENLHVFFHDRPESNCLDPQANIDGIVLEGKKVNNTSLIAVKFNRDGSTIKKIIADNNGREFRFSPTRSYSVYKNEMIYSGIKWKVGGYSTLTLGTISLN